MLGFLFNNSENLMLGVLWQCSPTSSHHNVIIRVCSANPLATNFKLTDGQVQITVPNVPTRRDYIVVGESLLFPHRLAA